jgi:hypothetical protein
MLQERRPARFFLDELINKIQALGFLYREETLCRIALYSIGDSQRLARIMHTKMV